MTQIDAIVIGAGYSGAVMAERMASQLNWQILLFEQRDHVAGNCYDEPDADGTLVHVYGPHLFHTCRESVWQYLSGFTDWQPYEHKVLASIDNALLPLPFNLNSIDAIFPDDQAQRLRDKLLSHYGDGAKVPILEMLEVDDSDLKKLAQFVYEKVFLNYTSKQWGVRPDQIAPEVTARVPVVVSRDDRYFQDCYQAMPKAGYTKMFQNLLDQPQIQLQLTQNCRQRLNFDKDSQTIFLDGNRFTGTVVYTGMLDELFDYCFGTLPYRSLRFEFEHLQNTTFQNNTTVNYPNDFDYTRITEFKHIANASASGTTIVREYPQDYDRDDSEKNIPYYPVFNDENRLRHAKYLKLAESFDNLIVLGRLADYRYYNMDDAAGKALQTFANLQSKVMKAAN